MNRWTAGGKIVLRLSLVAAGVYFAATFYDRAMRPRLVREQPKRQVHIDHYTFLPKSYVRDFESAKKLIGKPLWVKDGYRWIYQPGDEAFGPLEKIVPTGVAWRGRQVVLQFEKAGRREYTAKAVITFKGKKYKTSTTLPISLPWNHAIHRCEATWRNKAKNSLRLDNLTFVYP